MDRLSTVWFIVVLLIILTRVAFAYTKKQAINPQGLLIGGYFGAFGGAVVGGLLGVLLSRATFDLITFIYSGLNIDIGQVIVYSGISGAIIGTVGGATVGAIGGSQPKDIEKIPKSVYVWLFYGTTCLAFIMMGIGFSIVAGKGGGLAMVGALLGVIQWRIFGGKQWFGASRGIGIDDRGYLISMFAGYIIWTIVTIFIQGAGGIAVGLIGGTIVGIAQWMAVENEWLHLQNSRWVSLQKWLLSCAVLGAIFGGIIELFTEYIRR